MKKPTNLSPDFKVAYWTVMVKVEESVVSLTMTILDLFPKSFLKSLSILLVNLSSVPWTFNFTVISWLIYVLRKLKMRKSKRVFRMKFCMGKIEWYLI